MVYLKEMAIINPKLCKQLSIQIEVEQRDEGMIPHLHCYLDKTRNPKNCAYIDLTKADYTSYHKDNKKLGKKKEEFLKVMNSLSNDYLENSDGDIVRLTGYQSAIKTWCDTFEDGKYDKFQTENGIPKQIDYSKL